MIEKYNVLEIARSITIDGYFPDKNLIVVKENEKLFVIEGNRRLSALKSLLNPDIVNEKHLNKFNKLSIKIEKDYIKNVPIIIAPSREAANPIIFKEHTGNIAMPWSVIMQAEFYMRQIKNGISIEVLEEDYHRPRSEINKFLKLYYMHNIAQKIKYENKETQEKVEDKQNFPASTLERIFNSLSMREFLGISFDNEGNVRGNKDKKEFEKAYNKVISDLVNKKIDSRNLNTEYDIKEYTKKIYHLRPQTDGEFTYLDFTSDTIEENIPVIKKVVIKTTSKSIGIIPTGVPFNLKAANNLQIVYNELKKLPVKKYPNSSAAMLRIFLDKSLRIYLKKLKIKTIPVKNKNTEEKKKLSDIELGEIIDYLIQKDVNIIDDNNVKKTLKKFKNPNKNNLSASLSALNSVVHNEEFSLKEEEVRSIWLNLEGLFRIILIEPKV